MSLKTEVFGGCLLLKFSQEAVRVIGKTCLFINRQKILMRVFLIAFLFVNSSTECAPREIVIGPVNFLFSLAC